MELPPGHLVVLAAMTWPDPGSPQGLDSPALALCRRLPSLAPSHAADLLRQLNALGLTSVPDVDALGSPEAAADMAKWITEEGWKALRPG
jgi:hypothetical protein